MGKNNPWWYGREDPKLAEWERMKIRWVPEWVERLSFKPFSLNIVVGPRQVGKTTGIKLAIRNLLRSRDPYSIFYFNCDFTAGYEHLRKTVDHYLELASTMGIKEALIFLDEVTSVHGWWRVVKGYIDIGVFKNHVITVTGSSSLRLKGEIELFPGRRGEGVEVEALPLTFREYCTVKGLKIDPEKNNGKIMAQLSIHREELLQIFKEYVMQGGFPLSVNKDPRASEYFLASLEGEVLRAGKSWELTQGIISSIFRKAPSPVSYSAIAADVGVSYKTVQEYIEMLQRLYIVGVALHRDGRRIMWRKEKKIFIQDPFIAWTLSEWTGEKFLESALYEWIVQAHLKRKIGEICYYRGKYEIDCIAADMKIEVKAGKPHRKYPPNVRILEYEDIPIFLYALNHKSETPTRIGNSHRLNRET